MRFKLLIICLLICRAGYSQDFIRKKKLADGYNTSFDFYKAIPIYDQLLKSHPDDSELYEKLASIYDHLNDSQNAEKCYTFLVSKKEIKPEYMLNYAKALSKNGKYDQAVLWYGKYMEAQPSDPRGGSFSEAYRNLKTFFRDSASFVIKKAPFSTKADEFSPAYFGGSIIFSCDRSDYSKVHFTYNWTQSPYLDLYQAKPDTKDAKPFSKDLNSIYHEGPVTFTKNQDTIVFTRSNYFRSHLHKSSEGINKLSLFQSVWDAGQKRWIELLPLLINNDQYSVEHPALSPDGGKLYFASDMPGGLGEMDLYVSQRITGPNGEKTWGTPVNLGSGINTPGNELFPFIDQKGNLWYASNGIPGLGGLDIFFSGKSKEGFLKPINPGYPMNTRFDDFGFITQNEGEEGFLSSNRNNSYGNDDIYSVSRPFRKLVVWVFDARTKQGIASTQVDVLENGAAPESIENESAIPVALKVNPFKSYQFRVNKATYKTCSVDLTSDQLLTMDTIKIPLIRDELLINLTGLVYAANGKKPLPGCTVVIRQKSNLINTLIKSDLQGLFYAKLQPEADYEIGIVNIVAEGKCSAAEMKITTKGLLKDSIFHLAIPVYCVGDVIVMEDIYYDLNKYNIRPDAARVLGNLLNLMNDYPKMTIELRSHTDSRASAAYNLKLSDNRAKSAAEYLFSKGIARNRIIGRGYGETMLINKCSDGVPCSEEEHQRNRRTEFKILKME